MSLHDDAEPDSSPQVERARRVDKACDRFEERWQAGLQPRIEQYLEGTNEPERSLLLRELLLLELACFRQSGTQPRPDDYYSRFPNDTKVISDVFDRFQRCDERSDQDPAATLRRHALAPAGAAIFSTGQKIGRYTVERRVGQGAFGAVYLAQDEQLQRSVAIKVPCPDSILDAEEFIKEARTVAKLKHPAIVSVYDADRQQDGMPFVVMEYVEGSSLRDFLKSQRSSHMQLVELFAQIADAVHHAHKHGFIHRDLKPANVLLDNDEKPHVADFGFALHESVQRHHRGDASGTPAYRSPEQVRGQADWMDGRCDIWALGIMLYEALTGRRPFRDDEEILSRAPKPPRQIDDKIPELFERVCLRCLSKSVEDRYPTADALARELRQAAHKVAGDTLPVRVGHDASGNAVISCHGNVVTVQVGERVKEEPEREIGAVGPNPYKGLFAFDESDADRFFGREEQTQRLWTLLRDLCERTAHGGGAPRLLAVLGPSGCGKSSLARAGLLAELARRPLPRCKHAAVAVLSPGVRPLERLASVLARIATKDPAPVEKAAEFERLMTNRSEAAGYDGLRRIADMLPGIETSPLIMLVDQFEELYSLCELPAQREIFTENLLHAAADQSGRIAVVITLRSDFLGATQDHQHLNSLIATQGVIVPAMTEAELRRAITEPARHANHPLDKALVDLLVDQIWGREGSLPLLQFALARIWDGLKEGDDPVETLARIGGVGGALAGEAERIYSSLDDAGRATARRVFLALVQLGEGTRDTRRRASIDEMVAHDDDLTHVRAIISQFAARGARLISVSAGQDDREIAEVTHEALFEHWATLNEWLDISREDIRFHRRIDEAARHWSDEGRPVGLLWRQPDLDLLRQFRDRSGSDMTPLQLEFSNAARQRDQTERRRKQRRVRLYQVTATILGVLICVVVWLASLSQKQAKHSRLQLYISDVSSAYEAWEQNNIPRIRTLLERHRPERRGEDLRDFAWHYLWTRYQDTLASSAIQHPGVTSLALSSDGTKLASTGSGVIRMWDLANNNCLWERPGRFRALAFSPDDTALALGGISIELWEVTTGVRMAEMTGAGQMIACLAFSPDGDVLASGHGIGVAKLWDARNQELLNTLRGHKQTVLTIAFTPDGRTLASGGRDDTLRLWDIKTGRQLHVLSGRNAHVQVVAFSPNGRRLVVGGWGRFLRIWDFSDLERPKELRKLHARNMLVAGFGFLDDDTLVVGQTSGALKVWDMPSGDLCATLVGHADDLKALACARKAKRVASGSVDGTVRLWDLEGIKPQLPRPVEGGWLTSVALTGDGQIVARARGSYLPPDPSAPGEIRLWNVNHGQERVLNSEGAHLLSVALSPDDKLVACGGHRCDDQTRNGFIAVWNVATGKPMWNGATGGPRRLGTDMGSVRAVAFSPDGDVLATGSWGEGVKLWNARDGRHLRTLEGSPSIAFSLAFSPDGLKLAAGGGTWGDGMIALWDISSGERLATFTEHRQLVTSVAFMHDGETLATADYEGKIKLWAVPTETYRALLGHALPIRSMALSPSGAVLASAGYDGVVKLWHTTMGDQLGELSAGQIVYSLSFSADGNVLAGGLADGSVELWLVGGRNLTLGP